ncbi:hypothetical protein ACIBBD_18230 [Streptomyces sp. NPDC051315]|uniref:hypothetical protein n=1 Tax=Streptomyces sp. NPDC051315 TaxID=3365650 RepID=UPI0037B862E1
MAVGTVTAAAREPTNPRSPLLHAAPRARALTHALLSEEDLRLSCRDRVRLSVLEGQVMIRRVTPAVLHSGRVRRGSDQ